MPRGIAELHSLARLHGVQTAYYDVSHRRCTAAVESLLAAFSALGVQVASLDDTPAALADCRARIAAQLLEPVHVVWDGAERSVFLRLPPRSSQAAVACHVQLESGETTQFEIQLSDCLRLSKPEHALGEGCRLPLPGSLPRGYHQLTIEIGGQACDTLLIVAPRRAYAVPRGEHDRIWGAFLPVYAVRSKGDWGAGDFAGLSRLSTWLNAQGAQVLATLPFLAAYLDEPFDPSPYAPVSRLFWNEFFLDVTRLPELQASPRARRLVESTEFRAEIDRHRNFDRVDYRSQMRLKRRVLEALSQTVFECDSDRRRDLLAFVAQHPELPQYARFRAVTETRRATWPRWPAALRDRQLDPCDSDENTERYHVYVQWAAWQQVQSLAEGAGPGAGLYLDFPLGVSGEGYDVWRHRGCFALKAAAGAAPDSVFTKGQSWGFPPLHPQGIRADRYRYFIACIRHHLQFARLLRIDHIMGLHRLFWIPQGMSAAQGVYVQYPAEELYAILCLESHRYTARLFGENLGTVPATINRAMSRHNVRKMHVVQYELRPTGPGVLPKSPPGSIASINTHDMPPFAAFWRGDDIDDRLRLGLLDEASAADERQTRDTLRRRLVELLLAEGRLESADDDPASILRACLERLADGPAEVVIINLEDLWLDPQAQNVPATGQERPNWQHKARHTLDELPGMSRLLEILKSIDQRRRGNMS